MAAKEPVRNLLGNDRILRQITELSEISYQLDNETLGAIIDEIIISKKLLEGGTEPPVDLIQIPVAEKDQQQSSFLQSSDSNEAAIKYFSKNLDIVVGNAIRDLLLEAIYKAIRVQTEQGTQIGGKTEYKAYNSLLEKRVVRERKRIGLRRTTKGKLFWSAAKRREMFREYKKLLKSTKAAKQFFNKHYEIKTIGKTLRDNVPGLPEEIYESVLKSKRLSPKEIVLTYLSPKYNNTTLSYFNNLLNKSNAETKQSC